MTMASFAACDDGVLSVEVVEAEVMGAIAAAAPSLAVAPMWNVSLLRFSRPGGHCSAKPCAPPDGWFFRFTGDGFAPVRTAISAEPLFGSESPSPIDLGTNAEEGLVAASRELLWLPAAGGELSTSNSESEAAVRSSNWLGILPGPLKDDMAMGSGRRKTTAFVLRAPPHHRQAYIMSSGPKKLGGTNCSLATRPLRYQQKTKGVSTPQARCVEQLQSGE